MPTQTFSAAQQAFLEAYPRCASITAAARAIGIHRQTVYDWQHADPVFADALLQAKEATADELEAELFRRAMAGEGQMPDTLGIFLLKGYRPQFRDSYNVNVRQESVSLTIDFADLGPSDKAALLSRLADKLTTRQAPAELPPPTD